MFSLPLHSRTSRTLEDRIMGSSTSTTAVGWLKDRRVQPSRLSRRVLLVKTLALLSSPHRTARLEKTARPHRVAGRMVPMAVSARMR